MRTPNQPPQLTLESLVDDQVLDEAWSWLCKRRHDYPASSDIWWLRQDWATERAALVAQLTQGDYQFTALHRLTRSDGSVIELWCARDSLVLKALSIVLGRAFCVSPCCTHVKGHGGAKAALRAVEQGLSEYRFVFRTDVKSFYASIDHLTLYDQLCDRVSDRHVRRLLWQYLRRTVEHGGLFQDIEKGISLGCPLSPLIGAICLQPIDEALQREELFYIRFMDDWIVLAKTRRHLRRAVKITNQILSDLKLAKHPDKTFIGMIKKGFDFLGYHFCPEGLRVAQSTLTHFSTHVTRLYEQSPSTPEGVVRVGNYVKRWLTWVQSGGLTTVHLTGTIVELVVSQLSIEMSFNTEEVLTT